MATKPPPSRQATPTLPPNPPPVQQPVSPPLPSKKPPKKTPRLHPHLSIYHLLLFLVILLTSQLLIIRHLSSVIQKQLSHSQPTISTPPLTTQLLKEYPQLKDRIDTALPSNSHLVNLIEYLDSIAQNFHSQIRLESNEPLTSPHSPSPYIPFTLTGTLTFDQLISLTQQLEQPSYLIDIVHVQATTPTGLQQPVEFIIKAQAYVSPN